MRKLASAQAPGRVGPLDFKLDKISSIGYYRIMINRTEIKKEIQSILMDYRETMTKDLEQSLVNLHDEIESDTEQCLKKKLEK